MLSSVLFFADLTLRWRAIYVQCCMVLDSSTIAGICLSRVWGRGCGEVVNRFLGKLTGQDIKAVEV